jgi:hypothetical protein
MGTVLLLMDPAQVMVCVQRAALGPTLSCVKDSTFAFYPGRISTISFKAALAMIALALGAHGLADEPLEAMAAKPLNAASAPLLETEEVGIASVEAWVTKAALFQTRKGEWRQMLVKKENRGARQFWVVTLTLDTGRLTEHGPIKGYGQSRTAWSGGKLYFTTWLPGGFHVYDPTTDRIAELPMPFVSGEAGAFRMSVSPDGVIAMGAGGVAEVTMYDPRRRRLTKFGKLSDSHGFVYELGSDNRYIYAALRGKSPWELVAIHKKTRERRALLTTPVEGYMNVSGTSLSVRLNLSDTNDTSRSYELRNGELAQPATNAPPKATASPQRNPEPQVLLDESPLFEGKSEMAIHYQNPKNTNEWKIAHVAAPLASENTLALTTLDDGRIAAIGGPYNPCVVFDPKTGAGKQAPFAPLSGRCMLAIGPVIYASGYPSTALMRWDTSQPITPRTELPDQPAIPDDDPRANPRLLGHFSQSVRSGGHMGVRMFKGADGCVSIVTARHRHNLGFDVVWYNPADGTKGEIEDNGCNDHLAVSWAGLIENGRKLVLSTTIEKNRQLTNAVPENARLLVVDLVARKYVGQLEPLPGFKALTGIVEIAPNKLVGLAPGPTNATTYVYRYDYAAKKMEQVVRYNRLIFGLQGTSALPGKGYDFVVGPDGKIWTGMETAAEEGAFLRIDPTTLEVSVLGRIKGGSARFAFAGNDVYVNSAAKVRRLILPRP